MQRPEGLPLPPLANLLDNAVALITPLDAVLHKDETLRWLRTLRNSVASAASEAGGPQGQEGGDDQMRALVEYVVLVQSRAERYKYIKKHVRDSSPSPEGDRQEVVNAMGNGSPGGHVGLHTACDLGHSLRRKLGGGREFCSVRRQASAAGPQEDGGRRQMATSSVMKKGGSKSERQRPSQDFHDFPLLVTAGKQKFSNPPSHPEHQISYFYYPC